MNRISAVCEYIERGWPVFPCLPSKRPNSAAAPNGVKDASLELEHWRDWWVQHPDDCIGIATGIGSNLVVIDVDSYKDPELAAQFREMCKAEGLPTTYTVRTGQGGFQLYFRMPDGIVIRNSGKLSQWKVDVRGEGGYVIGAGSESIYGPYEVIRDAEVALLPDWIVDLIMAVPERQVEDADIDMSGFTDAERAEYDRKARIFWDKELSELRKCSSAAVDSWPAGYTGPDWDSTTFNAACCLLELAHAPWNTLTETDAYEALLRDAPRDAGFGDREILAKWDSARKKVAGNPPRALPAMHPSGGVLIPFPEGQGQALDPNSFFDKKGLLTASLAHEVLEIGPLAIDNTRNAGIWAYRDGVWREAPREISDRCVILLNQRFRPNHVTTVLPMIQQRLAAERAIITCEPVPRFVNVLNGMLDWATGTLYDHDPGFYSTVQLPVRWEPTAACPAFDNFVQSVMEPDAIDFLWEILGYMVYSGNPFQKAILLHGEGGNGKGTLIRVMQALLGTANVSSVTLQDMTEGKFETASLFGRIANLAGDIDPSYLRSTAKFKAITGEDTIEAQRKFEHGFRFKCWAVPVFSANRLWKSVDTSSGYRRRWIVVPFPRTFEGEMDAGLTEKITARNELEGILVQSVAALRALMARQEFDAPESVRRAKGEFEVASDQVREWLEDDPAIEEQAPGSELFWTSAGDAYRAYRNWSEASGHGSVSASEFKARLTRAGFVIRKVSVSRVYGIKIDVQLRHLAWTRQGGEGSTREASILHIPRSDPK